MPPLLSIQEKEIKKDKENADAYLRLSELYLLQNKKEDAKKILYDLTEVDLENGRAYWELGKIFLSEKKDHEAIAQFQNAVVFIKGNAELHYEMGKIYFDLRDFRKSKQAFLKAQDVDKSYKDIERYLLLIEKIEKGRE